MKTLCVDEYIYRLKGLFDVLFGPPRHEVLVWSNRVALLAVFNHVDKVGWPRLQPGPGSRNDLIQKPPFTQSWTAKLIRSP